MTTFNWNYTHLLKFTSIAHNKRVLVHLSKKVLNGRVQSNFFQYISTCAVYEYNEYTVRQYQHLYLKKNPISLDYYV